VFTFCCAARPVRLPAGWAHPQADENGCLQPLRYRYLLALLFAVNLAAGRGGPRGQFFPYLESLTLNKAERAALGLLAAAARARARVRAMILRRVDCIAAAPAERSLPGVLGTCSVPGRPSPTSCWIRIDAYGRA